MASNDVYMYMYTSLLVRCVELKGKCYVPEVRKEQVVKIWLYVHVPVGSAHDCGSKINESGAMAASWVLLAYLYRCVALLSNTNHLDF